MILALAVGDHRLGADLTGQRLSTCLALPWSELVSAVAEITWWPCAYCIPVGFALGAPKPGDGHPHVTVGQTDPPGSEAGAGQPAAPRLCLGSREKEAGCAKKTHNSSKQIPRLKRSHPCCETCTVLSTYPRMPIICVSFPAFIMKIETVNLRTQ